MNKREKVQVYVLTQEQLDKLSSNSLNWYIPYHTPFVNRVIVHRGRSFTPWVTYKGEEIQSHEDSAGKPYIIGG